MAHASTRAEVRRSLLRGRPVTYLLVWGMVGLSAAAMLFGALWTHSVLLAAQQPAAQAASGQPSSAAPQTRMFASDAGMVLNFIKPDKTADFEAVMAKLKEALQKSDKPMRKQQAASWRVFKGVEPGGNGNVLYLFTIDPAVKGADYTVSTILAEAFPAEALALYKQYAEAYAMGQNVVNLNRVAGFEP